MLQISFSQNPPISTYLFKLCSGYCSGAGTVVLGKTASLYSWSWRSNGRKWPKVNKHLAYRVVQSATEEIWSMVGNRAWVVRQGYNHLITIKHQTILFTT